MELKIKRVATFIERFGLTNGLRLYFGLRKNNLSRIHFRGLNFPIYLRPGTTDNAIFDQIFLHREYDISISFNPEVIVDAGAHIGLFSVFMANKYPDATLISIEPGKENFQYLQRNTSPYRNLKAINFAIWDRVAKVAMDTTRDLGQSGLKASENSKGDIDAITLSMIFDKFCINHIDILKIDIETAEKIIFSRGFEDWMPRVRMIVIELHDWLQPGCARAFFDAVNQMYSNYRYQIRGENTIIENLDFDL